MHFEFKIKRKNRNREQEISEIKRKTFSEIRNSYDSSNFTYDIQQNTT